MSLIFILTEYAWCLCPLQSLNMFICGFTIMITQFKQIHEPTF